MKLEAELIVFADEEHPDISPRIRGLIEDMRVQWRSLDARIVAFDKEFMTMAQEDEAAKRLMNIPEIGAINATAFDAAVGNAEAFWAWSRSGSMAWSHPQASLDWRPTEATGDIKAQ